MNLMNGIRLFDRPVRLQLRSGPNSGQSGTSSCPGTPVIPTRPNLLPPNPSVIPSPTNMFTRMGHPLHLPASPGQMPLRPIVASAVPHQVSSFHRSYSVPEISHSGGKMLHGTNGLVDDHRSPYARPGNADRSPYQRQCDQYCASPEPDGTAFMTAQLHVLRHMNDMQSTGLRPQQGRTDLPSPSGQYHHHHHHHQQQRSHYDSHHGSYSSGSRRHRWFH